MKRLILAALLMGFSGAALAQAPAPTPIPTPGRQPPSVDANHDGKVTLDELKAVEARGAISRLDLDHDGQITRAEFKPLVDFATQKGGEAGGKKAAGLFVLLDADRNGVVTKAERDAATARRFKMVDANHDGWLSKGEVTAMGQTPPRAN